MTGLQVIGQMAPLIPETLDKIDADKTVDEVWAITGAPMKVLRDDADIAPLRDARGKMAQQQMALQMAQQGADVVKTGSEVDTNMAKSKEVKK